MISRQRMTKILCGNFDKSLLEWESFKKDLPPLPSRNFLLVFQKAKIVLAEAEWEKRYDYLYKTLHSVQIRNFSSSIEKYSTWEAKFLQATMQFYMKFPQCINMLITTFLTIFERFQTNISDDVRRFIKRFQRRTYERFWKLSEILQILPKTSKKDMNMHRSYSTPIVKGSKIILKMLSRLFGYKYIVAGGIAFLVISYKSVHHFITKSSK